MRAIRWGVAALIVCAVAFATTTLFGEDNAAREARDRADIEALMWKYTRALDSGDGATYASTYTDNGQFSAGASAATKGREALARLVVRQPVAGAPARPPLYHMELNHWIEFVTKDRVRYHAYYLTVSGAMGQETPARIVAAGQSLDTMARVNGKWLIETRDVAAKE
jgi:SnoaL-like domain